MSAASPLTPPKGWERDPPEDGITAFHLASWGRYMDLLETEIFTTPAPKHRYIWRGQRSTAWSLQSSLDRLFDKLNLRKLGPSALERLSAEHLKAFRRAALGRRGSNPADLGENEWWALGQHFGLATPLLDWTRSPFAAAYFAFEELAGDQNDHRVVYALDQDAVELKNEELWNGPSMEHGRPPLIEFIDPMSDENQRLVSQGGLFTRAPIGLPIERWVAEYFEGAPDSVLMRIEIPGSDRLACLRSLSRMNISHLSLFPDLSGSSRATNLKLELEQEGIEKNDEK